MDRRHVLMGSGALIAMGATATFLTTRQMGSQKETADATQKIREHLSLDPSALDIVRFATLAPNGHNAQPWKFSVEKERITIMPDLSRRTPIVDPDDHHLFISLGAAAENLAIAGAARGRHGQPRFESAGNGSIIFAHEGGAPVLSPLFDAIRHRQSTRANYDGRSVSSFDLNLLANTASVPGVDLVLLTDRRRIDQVRDLVMTGNTAQMADPAFVRELKHWLRFNPRQAMNAGDGLYSVASGNPALPSWLGPVAFDWLSTSDSQNKSYADQINSSAGIAVFAGTTEDPLHWVSVGHACQRFALQATVLGLKCAFINQPVEVASLRSDLAALSGLPGRRPDLVMRFGYGPTLPRSMRRPVASVITSRDET